MQKINMNIDLYSLLPDDLNIQCKKNQNICDYTTWKVGGPADYLYEPECIKDLSRFLSFVPESVPITFLGGGSNLLVRDSGIRGIVIVFRGRNKFNKIQQPNDFTVKTESGCGSGVVGMHCVKKGLKGLEFLVGIPGSIGGALAMNAGAHGMETWRCVKSVETIDRFGNIYKRFPEEYKIGYRTVIHPYNEFFISATFKLQEHNSEELENFVKESIKKRSQTQPLDLPNAGSVFRNPKNDFAARLIESSNLKGYRIGGASVSEKHANFIVNDRNASAFDIEMLIKYIQEKVYDIHSIMLETEVKIIGV